MYRFMEYDYSPSKQDYSSFIIENFETWLAQNKGEYIDCFEGSLLDYSIIACKGGIAFIFEEYRNTWSSVYKCYFFRFSKTETEDYKQIEKEWYNLQEEYERQVY